MNEWDGLAVLCLLKHSLPVEFSDRCEAVLTKRYAINNSKPPFVKFLH